MRDTSPRHWYRWRVTLAVPTPPAAIERFRRMPLAAVNSANAPEEPGPDGIRHKLVARIRQEIAAGTYDTEERWLAAEAELLRRIEQTI